jgi:hypothetical protein
LRLIALQMFGKEASRVEGPAWPPAPYHSATTKESFGELKTFLQGAERLVVCSLAVILVMGQLIHQVAGL